MFDVHNKTAYSCVHISIIRFFLSPLPPHTLKKLVFATNNAHKLSEIRAILGDTIQILSLDDIGCTDEIPETADTLEGNALQKAHYIYDKYGCNCFADDTGL